MISWVGQKWFVVHGGGVALSSPHLLECHLDGKLDPFLSNDLCENMSVLLNASEGMFSYRNLRICPRAVFASFHQAMFCHHFCSWDKDRINSQGLIVCRFLCRYINSLLRPLTAFSVALLCFPSQRRVKAI